MLFETCRNGQHVRIEDDVGRVESEIDQQSIRALTNIDLSLDRVGLAALVEGHDDNRGAVPAHELCFADEILFAFFQRDRIDDGFALHAFQTRFDDRPPGAVDHDGHARDFRLRRDVIQEHAHGVLRIEHPLVHVHVDHVRAAAHLLERDVGRFAVLLVSDQTRESFRTGDVRALADHLEVRVRTNGEDFQTR